MGEVLGKVIRVKIRGRLYVQHRDNKGRIITTKRWHPKKFNLKHAQRRVNSENTIEKDTNKQIKLLKNVYEVTDYKLKKRHSGFYQYYVEVNIDGTIIEARSFKHDHTFPFRKARDEALQLLYRRISGILLGETDPDEGKALASTSKIREAIVYYRAL